MKFFLAGLSVLTLIVVGIAAFEVINNPTPMKQVVSSTSAASTKASAHIEKVNKPNIDRRKGIDRQGFWELYNYYIEKDKLAFPKVKLDDHIDILDLSLKKVHLGNGVYLGYYHLGDQKEKYGTVYLIGDEIDHFDISTMRDAFKLVAKIMEGENSSFVSNSSNNFKELIKGRAAYGDHLKWTSSYKNAELQFMGNPDFTNNKIADTSKVTNKDNASNHEVDKKVDSNSQNEGFTTAEYVEHVSKEQKEAIIVAILGKDFKYDPNVEYNTENWTILEQEALMMAESLYYESIGKESPYN
ncbi:hypothetical protein [Bacillus sp. FJAT-49736]|uniref:hypothetical protein n=1 Tax=Bacillus sp. FJAT-49736 TaxID=2833582 RepID=UPI001BC8E652|nr:hypothetical protein [Bacillus sp. FJAT-49736]MBS4172882.1 hypothetical protein [Bacillus sp. FJAT-49736]